MPDPQNTGQFGNRDDTEEQASQGGESSPGQFGASKGADPHEEGQQGAEAQPRDAKVEGGHRSHGGSGS